MMKPLDSILQYLEMAANMRGNRGPEQFLLDHGMACGRQIDSDLPLMRPKNCYHNSFMSVTGREVDPEEWFYCEGYAVQPKLGLPMQHAWLVNREGEVLDRTPHWDDPDTAYFGVPVDFEYLCGNALRTGYPSVFWADEMFNVDLLDLDPAEFRAELNPGAVPQPA